MDSVRRSKRVRKAPERYSPPPIDFEDDFHDSEYDSGMEISDEGFSDISDSETEIESDDDDDSIKDFIANDSEDVEEEEDDDEQDEEEEEDEDWCDSE